MKKNFLFTIALLVLGFTFNSLNAQVQEKEALMSLGDQNALTIDIQNVDKKALESYYKGYFKEFGKVKFNRKANEYYINAGPMALPVGILTFYRYYFNCFYQPGTTEVERNCGFSIFICADIL